VKLLVGLGNPGLKYVYHRHNLGFMALNAIVARYSTDVTWETKFRGAVCKIMVDGLGVLALKPMTYMNASGVSVRAVTDFYKLSYSDIILLHDEMDLAAGTVKIKTGGSHAGHNGVRSVQELVGSDVCRVRLGIGRPDNNRHPPSRWVLSDFVESDQFWLPGLLRRVACNVGKLLHGDRDSGIFNYDSVVGLGVAID